MFCKYHLCKERVNILARACRGHDGLFRAVQSRPALKLRVVSCSWGRSLGKGSWQRWLELFIVEDSSKAALGGENSQDLTSSMPAARASLTLSAWQPLGARSGWDGTLSPPFPCLAIAGPGPDPQPSRARPALAARREPCHLASSEARRKESFLGFPPIFNVYSQSCASFLVASPDVNIQTWSLIGLITDFLKKITSVGVFIPHQMLINAKPAHQPWEELKSPCIYKLDRKEDFSVAEATLSAYSQVQLGEVKQLALEQSLRVQGNENSNENWFPISSSFLVCYFSDKFFSGKQKRKKVEMTGQSNTW